MKRLCSLASVTLLAFGFSAFTTGLFGQEPPIVSYRVSGTPGNYTLDFTVNNGSPGTENQDIYFIGVDDPDGTISAIPAGYANHGPFNVSTVIGVGTTFTYNNVWIDPSATYLPTGTSLSGFDILDTSFAAPTAIPYFAVGFGQGAAYTGPGSLWVSVNPVFEGIATSGTVPDGGATTTLLGLALGALCGVSLRFRIA